MAIFVSYLSLLMVWLFLLTQSVSSKVLQQSSFPNGPFITEGSWILGADGANFTYAGINWPGAEQTMIPEGLQYQSIHKIVSRIKSLGMNSIRLTYATEMVDQIYDNDMVDVSIRKSFVDALGRENGTAVFNRVIENNPSFHSNTTRLEVYDAIAVECAKQKIYVHLDNHISKAGWCCTPFDGNAWWKDKYFSPSNWTRGLSFMAKHGKSWPNLMSMSLYNELRPPMNDEVLDLMDSYNWKVWYDQMKKGAAAIHAANPDVLIFLSGLDGDTDLGPVVENTATIGNDNGDDDNNINGGGKKFNPSHFAGHGNMKKKLVLELHSYDIVNPVVDCPTYNNDLLESGYSAMVGTVGGGGGGNGSSSSKDINDNDNKNHFPVVMTEWGFTQDATTWQDNKYATCVLSFLRDEVPGAGWMVWAISGSYYVREGKQDYNEPWGLLNHDWSDWRSPEFIDGGLRPLVSITLDAVL